RAQIFHVAIVGRHEQVALRAVARRMPHGLLEIAKKRNRIQRHANARIRGKLRAHAAHALARRSFALVRFALQDDDIAASRPRELISDAGPDDSASDDDHIRAGDHLNSLPFYSRYSGESSMSFFRN